MKNNLKNWKYIFWSIIIISLSFLNNCANNKKVENTGIVKNKETIKYYRDFGAKHYEPMILYNEISINEIKNERVYLKAFYENGKLLIVEKYLDQKLFFRFVYTYDCDKLVNTETFYGEGM